MVYRNNNDHTPFRYYPGDKAIKNINFPANWRTATREAFDQMYEELLTAFDQPTHQMDMLNKDLTGFSYETAGEYVECHYSEWKNGANYWCDNNGRADVVWLRKDGVMGYRASVASGTLERVRLIKR